MHRDVESTFPQHPGAPSYTPVHHTPEHVAPAHLRIPFSLLVIVALIAMLINVTVLRALGDEDDRWPIYSSVSIFRLFSTVFSLILTFQSILCSIRRNHSTVCFVVCSGVAVCMFVHVNVVCRLCSIVLVAQRQRQESAPHRFGTLSDDFGHLIHVFWS
jgi:hypothetical protein